MQNAKRAAQAKLMEIDRGITQLKRERQRNGIGDTEFKEKLVRQVAKKSLVRDDLQRRMRGG